MKAKMVKVTSLSDCESLLNFTSNFIENDERNFYLSKKLSYSGKFTFVNLSASSLCDNIKAGNMVLFRLEVGNEILGSVCYNLKSNELVFLAVSDKIRDASFAFIFKYLIYFLVDISSITANLMTAYVPLSYVMLFKSVGFIAKSDLVNSPNYNKKCIKMIFYFEQYEKF